MPAGGRDLAVNLAAGAPRSQNHRTRQQVKVSACSLAGIVVHLTIGSPF
jgi:hypothetical protein